MQIDESNSLSANQLEQNDSIDADEIQLNLQIKNYHSRNDFLVLWYELFHQAHFANEFHFKRDLLFNDRYLSQILSLGIPSNFEPIDETLLFNDEDESNFSQIKARRDDTQIELKLFNTIKEFYKERDLNITDVLKTIRLKKQASKRLDFTSWEKAYWQLLYIIFTAFYVENQQNNFLQQYFLIEQRHDFKALKVVLEIVSSVIKRTSSPEKENKSQLGKDNPMLIIDQTASQTDMSTYSQADDSQFIIQVNEFDQAVKHITDSSEGSRQGTEEDEDDDDLLKEDINGWDVFDDYHKFQLRDLKIKEKKRKIAKQEIKKMEDEKNQEIEIQNIKNLERECSRLENKLKIQEESLKKKGEREEALLNDIGMYETNMLLKQFEIEQLSKKMVLYETFKHKFDTKTKESERLLNRVEELSILNADLQDQIQSKIEKTIQLKKDLDIIRDKFKVQEPPKQADVPTIPLHKIQVRGHCREDSGSSVVSNVQETQFPQNSKILETQQIQNRVDSLQDELCIDSNSPNGNQFFIQNKNKSLDEEEMFDTSTYRSQYRFETTDTQSQQDDEDLMAEQLEGSLLRQQYQKEQEEKMKFRKLYLEFQERSHHYQQMMMEYEKLYTEFLTKSIKSEKEKIELKIRLQRVNGVSNLFTKSCNKCVSQQRIPPNKKFLIKGLSIGALITIIFILYATLSQ